MDIEDNHNDLTKDISATQNDQHLKAAKSKKEAFEESLICEPPSCPQCNKSITKRDIAKCSYCGFNFGYLSKIFPSDLPELGSINDFSKCLSTNEVKSLQKIIDKIRKKYPQIIVKLAFLPLQADVEIQQMSMWMLNECPLPALETDNDRLWSILLLVDTKSLTSCYTNGYKAEVFWAQDICQESIIGLNKALRGRQIFSSVEENLHNLLTSLDQSKKAVKSEYRKFKKKFY